MRGTQTGGADFAESVRVRGSRREYGPGDVLVVDPDHDRQILLSSSSYATTVAGIYSTKPGVLATPHEMDSPEFEQADFGHVRFFISGGAPCPPQLMAEWRRRKSVVFRQGYGLTEVGVNCFSMTNEESAVKVGSVGKPIFHSEMCIVQPETGTALTANQEGELWIRGPHVTTGYWRNPQATRAALSDGWFRTGDIARRDADGFYSIVGRYKDMIKSGGENIYAAEVEAVFREHPAVADAALIGQPDTKWGEVGLMVVMKKTGLSVTEDELIALCQGRLAKFKIPKRIVFAEGLPYSPYGKVIKTELRRKYVG